MEISTRIPRYRERLTLARSLPGETPETGATEAHGRQRTPRRGPGAAQEVDLRQARLCGGPAELEQPEIERARARATCDAEDRRGHTVSTSKMTPDTPSKPPLATSIQRRCAPAMRSLCITRGEEAPHGLLAQLE